MVKNLKDHDNYYEVVRTNDSYLDWFIDNAVLIEHHLTLETPMHEQTITSLEKDNFSSLSWIVPFRSKNKSFSESEEFEFKMAARVIIQNTPVLLKLIVEFLVKQKIQVY